MQTINVKITKRKERRYWLMYYDDPRTNKRVHVSTKQTGRRDAERAAAKWEAELREGRYRPPSKVDWQDFRQRYEDEVVASLARKTGAMVATVFNRLESICNPRRLADLDADRLSYFQSELRRNGAAETTIHSYLAHLRAALRWAVDIGTLAAAPKVKMPQRAARGAKMMKGRPITTEEFDRLLDKVEAGLMASSSPKSPAKSRRPYGDAAIARGRERQADLAAVVAPSWRHFLRGLWLSGLRLGEALTLAWDRDAGLSVEQMGGRPYLRIKAEHEKGNQDRLLALTPDFAAFLDETPDEQRTGPVFRPLCLRGGECRGKDWASRIISRIGQAAGVKVDVDLATGTVKYASAHDLRRAFGARWATRIMPTVLQELMRHESIETTLRYYVGKNAQATSDAVWGSVDARPAVPSIRRLDPLESARK